MWMCQAGFRGRAGCTGEITVGGRVPRALRSAGQRGALGSQGTLVQSHVTRGLRADLQPCTSRAAEGLRALGRPLVVASTWVPASLFLLTSRAPTSRVEICQQRPARGEGSSSVSDRPRLRARPQTCLCRTGEPAEKERESVGRTQRPCRRPHPDCPAPNLNGAGLVSRGREVPSSLPPVVTVMKLPE